MAKTQEQTETAMESSVGYEQLREDRIKENLERMQKLGILDLSLKLKPLKPNRPYTHKKTPPSAPVRRSSRLQNTTPVSYSEVNPTKKDESLSSYDDLLRAEGSKPEVYTDEHEKLLGTTEMSWTLFVDGYGSNGKRIYDPVKGKTCHQCRQKTLGHRTHCSQCNMVQGQFCGDCLYMRYGENVLEAKENPNWICPVCRGICNCSFCRLAKGWPPTGTLYRKVSSLGYKSVAHYLIQTRRAHTDSNKNDTGTNVPVSAKKSLPFSEIEVTPGEQDDLSKSNKGDSKTIFLDPTVDNKPDESRMDLETITESENTPQKDLLLKCCSSPISETRERCASDDNEIKKEEMIVPPTPDSIATAKLWPRRNKRNESYGEGNNTKKKEVEEENSVARRLKMRRRGA